MIQVIPKWRVTYTLEDGHTMELYLHDNHIENVVRRAAEITFGEPTLSVVVVGVIDAPPNNTSVYTP